jgi:2-polyprenyl-3-methyl-5-hydroxy-6-metoxy-1,4-benzoquinol methylase
MRDYNKEIIDNERKYVYNFDEMMHTYMVESFKPFFVNGTALELGSYVGLFTEKLIPFFHNITCIEASCDAAAIAKKKLGVNIINTTFDKADLGGTKYDNIFLTHVLEHVDKPIRLLEKIRNEWLAENGRLFLVCPNANAPSRQIAVKMGIISHNQAVTEAEMAHGHKITYTLDTLERDVTAAGLTVAHRSGIFFKALANFQWDMILQTEIISNEYLDGCYKLGHIYPDLCSSIFLLCEI